jgi:hypothetical protein
LRRSFKFGHSLTKALKKNFFCQCF